MWQQLSPSFRLTPTTETTLELNQQQQMLVANSKIIVLRHFNISRLWSLPNSFLFQILLKFHVSAEQTYMLQTRVVQTQPILTNYLLHQQQWGKTEAPLHLSQAHDKEKRGRINTDAEISLMWIPHLLQVPPAFSPLRLKTCLLGIVWLIFPPFLL